MTSAISSLTSGASSTRTGSGSGSASAVNRDDFLKLLVAQLSHQDPLQPTEGTEFVQQLSQFSLVEQSLNQSSQLGVISTQLSGLSSNEAVGLVGRTVTVRGHGIAFDGATATSASVNLAANAATVKATIRDSSGRVVRTIDLGPRQAGAVGVQWDGRDDRGNTMPRGTYSLTVEAKTAEGNSVNVTQDVSGRVTSVTFDRGYPELHLDTGVAAPISDLVSVNHGAAGGSTTTTTSGGGSGSSSTGSGADTTSSSSTSTGTSTTGAASASTR